MHSNLEILSRRRLETLLFSSWIISFLKYAINNSYTVYCSDCAENHFIVAIWFKEPRWLCLKQVPVFKINWTILEFFSPILCCFKIVIRACLFLFFDSKNMGIHNFVGVFNLESRICKSCAMNGKETEFHFLQVCKKYCKYRTKFFGKYTLVKDKFWTNLKKTW